MFGLFSLSSMACAPFTITATMTSVGTAVLWSYVATPLYNTAGYITKYAVSTGASYLWRKTTGSVTRYAATGAATYIAKGVFTKCINSRSAPKLLKNSNSSAANCTASADSVIFNDVSLAEFGPAESQDLPLVYFIRSGAITSNEYKIGRTKGAVEKRLAQLQTGSVNKLYVEFVIHTTDAPSLEACFHKRLITRKIRSEGEWFSLSRTELNRIEHLVKRWSLQDVNNKDSAGKLSLKDYSVYKILDTETFMIKVKDL